MQFPSITVLSGVTLLGFLGFASPAPLAADSDTKSVSEMSLAEEQKAVDAWLTQADAVERGRDAARLFALADRFLKAGQDEAAKRYLTLGLQANPWALDYQLTLGEVLARNGQPEALREKASMVLRMAESEATLLRATQLLGKPAPEPIPVLESPIGSDPILVLVPFGEVNRFALNDLRESLQRRLGIVVELRLVSIATSPADRSFQSRWIVETRKRLLQQLDANRLMTSFLSGHGISAEAIAKSDSTLLQAVRALVENQSGPKGVEDLQKMLAESARHKQWDAGKVLDHLWTVTANARRSNVLIMGVTSLDLFGGDSNFLFGSALTGKRVGIISAHRYFAAFNDEIPKRERLNERLLKQALSSFGFMLGVDRCTTPECVRAYPRSLAEHDSKPSKLCSTCRTGIERALDRMLPTEE